MTWTGKLIGGALGFIFAGPIGLLIGIFIGHLFDQGTFRQALDSSGFTFGNIAQVQRTFFDSTFAVMGYIAKADGRISESEIQAARSVMDQMGLSQTMKLEAIRLFNSGKQPDFNLNATLINLKKACWQHPSILQTFVEIQVQMAYVEGMSPAKQQALHHICEQLGVQGFSFDQFRRQYRAEQQYRRHSQRGTVDPKQHLREAYEVLGITQAAADAEVKKAYRRLMSKHHPDKLIAKGVPQEMVQLAKQKTQQINSAYETIKASRGMN